MIVSFPPLVISTIEPLPGKLRKLEVPMPRNDLAVVGHAGPVASGQSMSNSACLVGAGRPGAADAARDFSAVDAEPTRRTPGWRDRRENWVPAKHAFVSPRYSCPLRAGIRNTRRPVHPLQCRYGGDARAHRIPCQRLLQRSPGTLFSRGAKARARGRRQESQAWQNYLAWRSAICVESQQMWLMGALDTSAASED